MRSALGSVVTAILGLTLLAHTARAAEWNPSAWAGESTVELRTTRAGEAEHWFPVWLVVVDGQLYVRLGGRATERIEHNTTAPYVGVRIAGHEFDRVRGEPAPEQAERVAEALAAKYWSDVLIRYFSHPLTLRLVAEPQRAATP
jgi:hypothetical protein